MSYLVSGNFHIAVSYIRCCITIAPSAIIFIFTSTTLISVLFITILVPVTSLSILLIHNHHFIKSVKQGLSNIVILHNTIDPLRFWKLLHCGDIFLNWKAALQLNDVIFSTKVIPTILSQHWYRCVWSKTVVIVCQPILAFMKCFLNDFKKTIIKDTYQHLSFYSVKHCSIILNFQ